MTNVLYGSDLPVFAYPVFISTDKTPISHDIRAIGKFPPF